MAFGIIAIVIMLCTMNMDYTDIWRYLLKVGIYFSSWLCGWWCIWSTHCHGILLSMTRDAVRVSRFGVSTNLPSADSPSTTPLRAD